MEEQKCCFADIETECRENFRNHYQDFGYTFRQFAPAYRFGHSLADNELYRGKEWSLIEHEAFVQWEAENPSTWEEVHEAVRYAFCAV